MAGEADISLAKQALSGRLLSAGLLRGPSGSLFAMSVSEAVDNAGSNTHGVGIGLKVVDRKLTDQRCIRVHVIQKIAGSLIAPRDRIPAAIDGIPTDVIESIPAIIQAESDAGAAPDRPVMNMRTRQRPAVGGLSAGHFQITAGTIACFCRSTKAGDDPATKYVLSNNHVFANMNRAKIGDDIYQPGPIDGGDANAVIAKLHRFVALQMGGEQGNRIDAAIAELCAGIEFENAIHRIGAITGTTEAKLGLQVRKQGRTSDYTEGKIDDIEYDAIVGMDHQDPTAKAVFHGQMRIVASPSYPAIGLGGDSGSLVVELASQNAVGLYFAGPPGGNYGIADPIKDVLKELEIVLG